jgi:Cytochrome c7 and related cytochrome c
LNSSFGVTAKPATPVHATVTGNCETCHKSTASWAAAKVDHSVFTAATVCGTCHNGTTATGKTPNHVSTTDNCTTCHKAGYPNWLPAKFHINVSVTTGCASCHNGTTATGKSATHLPTTANCESCHKSTTTWIGTKVDHSVFTAATVCGTCHNGTTATGKTSNHIPTTANCSACHKAGYPNWFPGKFHSNISVLTGCAGCHATAAYGLTAKPATVTHNGATVCETCHKSTTDWLNVQFVHSVANSIGTGTCDTCHNGTTSAVSKSGVHIPIPAGIAKCDSCHKSQVSFLTSVTMNHTVVTAGTCKSCHNGAYVSQGKNGGAMAKVANHIPEAQLLNGAAMDCKACHTGTVAWTAYTMNHNVSMGSGAGWCYACHATGTNYLGKMLKMALAHKQAGKADCSTSGCHKPLGTWGRPYTAWN